MEWLKDASNAMMEASFCVARRAVTLHKCPFAVEADDHASRNLAAVRMENAKTDSSSVMAHIV
jgi:hypothetical protein